MGEVSVTNNAVTFKHKGQTYQIPPGCTITIKDKNEDGESIIDKTKDFFNSGYPNSEAQSWIDYAVDG